MMVTDSGIVTGTNGTLWTCRTNYGLESYAIIPKQGQEVVARAGEAIRRFYRTEKGIAWLESINCLDLMGNRQEGMTPVEYRVTEGPRPYGFGSVFVRGHVLVDDQKVGNWTVSIKQEHFNAVKKDLTEREQPMSKFLYEVYIVHKEEYLGVYPEIASNPEIARFNALKRVKTDIDIEDLDIFTKQIGILRDDCCK